MRKKSHISLAKHIVNIADIQNFDKHKKAFYVGSILPDCKPSFLTKRHEINGTFDLVEKGIEKLTRGYQNIEELSTAYFTRLGEVMHYIADYFTFPHNREYDGTMKEHCIYEERIHLEDLERFRSVADICAYLKEQHRNYIQQGRHSVEEDCRYIVSICSKAAFAILHVCLLSMGCRKGYVRVQM